MTNILRENLQHQRLKFEIKKVFADSGKEIHSFEMTPHRFQSVNISWLDKDLNIEYIKK